MKFDRAACDGMDQSVLGEEDPGAALDLFYRALETPHSATVRPPEVAEPQGPCVAAADRRDPDPGERA